MVKTVLRFAILVGRCTTHFRTYFSGDWDVEPFWDPILVGR